MFLASWSGGKDSCLACYRAMQSGIDVKGLVNFISDDYRRVRFHGVEARLIAFQAELAGLRLFQRETAADRFEDEFRACLAERLGDGYGGMVFGDIFLEDHRAWVERVCAEVGIRALEPLWGEPTDELMGEFISSGFRATIVSGMKEYVERDWVGRELSMEFMDYLKAKGADACGENGEYHSFVTAGPLFGGSIGISGSAVVERGGFWMLDIKDFEVNKLPLAV